MFVRLASALGARSFASSSSASRPLMTVCTARMSPGLLPSLSTALSKPMSTSIYSPMSHTLAYNRSRLTLFASSTPTTIPKRQIQVHTSLKLRCKHCRFKKVRRVLRVVCSQNGRHKQRQKG